ncbi:MAG: YegP family protein [Pseudomonadota bacterium]
MAKGTFELKKAANGKFHFNLKASNGQVIAQSQMYASKSTALKGVESVRQHAADAKMDDLTGE